MTSFRIRPRSFANRRRSNVRGQKGAREKQFFATLHNNQQLSQTFDRDVIDHQQLRQCQGEHSRTVNVSHDQQYGADAETTKGVTARIPGVTRV